MKVIYYLEACGLVRRILGCHYVCGQVLRGLERDELRLFQSLLRNDIKSKGVQFMMWTGHELFCSVPNWLRVRSFSALRFFNGVRRRKFQAYAVLMRLPFIPDTLAELVTDYYM
jgi:hypothetical protein